jgi:hypothetical protein
MWHWTRDGIRAVMTQAFGSGILVSLTPRAGPAWQLRESTALRRFDPID